MITWFLVIQYLLILLFGLTVGFILGVRYTLKEARQLAHQMLDEGE